MEYRRPEKAEYMVEVSYFDYSVRYYFSSERDKENFESKRMEHREGLSVSLSNRFKMNVRVGLMFSDIDLYRRVSKWALYMEGENLGTGKVTRYYGTEELSSMIEVE